MKNLEIPDATYDRLTALAGRLEWSVEKTLAQVIEDGEDLQSAIEEVQARELPPL